MDGPTVRITESTEQIARRIADAGYGTYPTSKLRDAIFEAAKVEIARVRAPLFPDRDERTVEDDHEE